MSSILRWGYITRYSPAVRSPCGRHAGKRLFPIPHRRTRPEKIGLAGKKGSCSKFPGVTGKFARPVPGGNLPHCSWILPVQENRADFGCPMKN